MLQIGEAVKLDNGKEYIVVHRMDLHTIAYIFLITTSKPLEVIIVTEKIINGEIVLDEVKDNTELDYILNKLAEESID